MYWEPRCQSQEQHCGSAISSTQHNADSTITHKRYDDLDGTHLHIQLRSEIVTKLAAML